MSGKSMFRKSNMTTWALVISVASGITLTLDPKPSFSEQSVHLPNVVAQASAPQTQPGQGWVLVGPGSEFDAVAAPLDHQPDLQPDFGDPTRIDRYVFTPTGYPLATILRRVPGCLNPYHANDAMQAWTTNDLKWQNTLRDCVILDANLKVEWMKRYDDLQLDQTVVRVKTAEGGRAVLYIGDMSNVIGTQMRQP
jgi:hypothetical protein